MTTQPRTAMTRRYFPPEYKLEAASKVLDDGMSIRTACETFDVGPTAMRRWVRQLRAERNNGDPDAGTKPLTPEQRRIRELEAENRKLREEKAILKKATAFFVREQTGDQWFSK